MAKIKNIMVAVDFSKYALPTARYAVDLARDLAAGVLFVNVVNQRDIDTVQRIMVAYESFNMDQFLKDRLKARFQELAEIMKAAGASVDASRALVRIGVPYEKLLEVIEEEHPDMLVMATKGRGDLADVVMGSCARMMLRRSPIPVLTICGKKYFE